MRYILLGFFIFSSYTIEAQINILNQAKESAGVLLHQNKDLNKSDVINALKEALLQGSDKAIASTSIKDGFNKNNLIRITWPEEAKKMKNVLIKSGMKQQVVEFEQKINRAAELASRDAKEILTQAIRSMSIKNAFSILNGDNDAATDYLKQNCSLELYNNFQPIVNQSIKSVGVMKYWNTLANSYNKIPFTKEINPNLEEHIIQGTINGIFILISVEENNIRNNQDYRVTELLKKVFN